MLQTGQTLAYSSNQFEYLLLNLPTLPKVPLATVAHQRVRGAALILKIASTAYTAHAPRHCGYARHRCCGMWTVVKLSAAVPQTLILCCACASSTRAATSSSRQATTTCRCGPMMLRTTSYGQRMCALATFSVSFAASLSMHKIVLRMQARLPAMSCRCGICLGCAR